MEAKKTIVFILFTLFPIFIFSQIEITNWDELQAIQNNLKGHYILMNDLGLDSKGYENYQNGEGFKPLGRDATIGNPGQHTFLGTFDGNNHIIKDLYINRPEEDYVGLFGSIYYGSVKNLGLEEVNIVGHKYVGGIAGLITDAHRYRIVLTNCYVTGKVRGLDVAVGGLVGRLYDAKISYCYSTADVCGEQSVGGLVGGFSFSELQNCYSSGYIHGSNYVGGLIGSASATAFKKLTIKNSFAKGKITGSDIHIGGLANTKAMNNLNVTSAYFQDKNGSNDIGMLEESNSFYFDITNAIYKVWPRKVWQFKKGKLPGLKSFKTTNNKEQSHEFCNDETNYLDPVDCVLACYPFNGNANDESANNHHGKLYGATLTSDRFGHQKSAYYFDGDNDKIEINDHPDLRLNNTDFTLSVWMMEETYSPNNNGALIIKRGLGGNNGWFLGSLGLDDHYEGNILFNVSGGGDPFNMTWSDDITLNEWHHVVVVYTLAKQEASIYIDGKLIKVQGEIPSPNPSATAKMVFGYDQATKKYDFKGKIDDITIFNCALSPDEMNTLEGCGNNKAVAVNVNETITLENIYFKRSKYNLIPRSYKKLDKLATYLLENKNLKILIQGHTDKQGDAAANRLLSENRAEAVSIYLLYKGVKENRIKTKGFGSSQPVADNSTEAGRQRNRRVEVMLMY